MEKLSEEQLRLAEEILKKRSENGRQEEAIALAERLEGDFEGIVTGYLGADPVRNEWLSQETLNEVVHQVMMSTDDFRHRYPYSVTALKYASVIAFWVVKLKPINVLGLKKDGEWTECSDINERVALKWLQRTVWVLITRGELAEFVEPSDVNKIGLKRLFQKYFHEPLYNKPNASFDPKNNKAYETVYYMRFKKMTAINIYESLTHMLLSLNCGFQVSQE